ncbi:MAG: hypothetical protein Kow0020_10360 [Wenzhouxiangellaceae bacterium]
MAGFTLVEVLVALVVVALALLALTRTAAWMVSTQDALERRSFALWAAANQLAELRLSAPLQAGTYRGRTRAGNHEWTWRALVTSAPGDRLWRVEVMILDEEQPLLTHVGFIER